jgi:hypothetical protein
MLIYYHGSHHRDDVLSDAPIDVDEVEAKSVLAGIYEERSFLGVVMGEGRTLQLYRQADGSLHAEVLETPSHTIRYCSVNDALAELLIEAAFRGDDFEDKIAFARLKWNDENLKRALTLPGAGDFKRSAEDEEREHKSITRGTSTGRHKFDAHFRRSRLSEARLRRQGSKLVGLALVGSGDPLHRFSDCHRRKE